MLNKGSFLFFISFCAIMSLGANTCPAQNSLAEFHKALSAKASFTETDFIALSQNQPELKILSPRDK